MSAFSRAWPPLFRRPGLWLGLSAFASLFFFLRDDPQFENDGFMYYLYLKSFFLEGQVNFHFNPFPIGSALLWSPFFALGHLYARYRESAAEPLFHADGWTWPYAYAISIGSFVYAWAGVVLLFNGLKPFCGKGASLAAVLAIYWGTPLAYYTIYEPTMSHAVSFFTVALFLWLLVDGWEGRTALGWLALGTAAGLMTLVRLQDGVFMLLIVPSLLAGHGAIARRVTEGLGDGSGIRDQGPGIKTTTRITDGTPTLPKKQKAGHSQKQKPSTPARSGKGCFSLTLSASRGERGPSMWAAAGLFATPLVFLFFLQSLTWKLLFGSWFLLAQGQGFLAYFHPVILKVLFSRRHGWFTWTPFALIGIAALILMAWRVGKPVGENAGKDKAKRWFWMGLLGLVGVQVYVNSTVWDWWGGLAFGARRFTSTLALLVPGLALLFQSLWPGHTERHLLFTEPVPYLSKPLYQRVIAGVTVLAVAWNLLLMMEVRFGLITLGPGVPITDILHNVVKGPRDAWESRKERLASETEAAALDVPPYSYDPEMLKEPRVDKWLLDVGNQEQQKWLVEHWSGPEDYWRSPGANFVWAVETECRVLTPPLVRQPYLLRFMAFPFAQNPERVQTVEALLNGHSLGKKFFHSTEEEEMRFPVAPENLRDGVNTLTLRHGYALSPKPLLKPNFAIGTTGVEFPFPLEIVSSAMARGYNAHIYVGGRNLSLERKGYNLLVVDPQRKAITGQAAFDVFGDPAEAQAMAHYIESLPNGATFALALKEFGTFFMLPRNDLRETLAELKPHFMSERGTEWKIGVKSLLVSRIDSAETKVLEARRFAIFESPAHYQALLDYLDGLTETDTLSVILEREANHDLPQRLLTAFNQCGLGYTPYMPCAVGVKGASPGTASFTQAPYQENYLYLGMNTDERMLSVGYDWIGFDPDVKDR